MNSRKLSFDLNDLPVDVFDVADAGLRVESLTAGHGMAELAGSQANTAACISGSPLNCSHVPPALFPENGAAGVA